MKRSNVGKTSKHVAKSFLHSGSTSQTAQTLLKRSMVASSIYAISAKVRQSPPTAQS